MGVKQEELNMDNEVMNNETVDAGTVGQSGVAQEVTTPQSSGHMFTQEQLNSIIAGRINPLNQRVTELSNQLAKAEKLTSQYHEELESYKRKEIALKEGISADLVDYAIFGASKLVSKDKTFEVALKEFKEANGSLFGATQQASGSENGSTQTNNNGQQAQGNQTSNGQSGTVNQPNQTQTVNMTSGANANQGGQSVEEAVQNYLKDRLKRR